MEREGEIISGSYVSMLEEEWRGCGDILRIRR